MKHLRSTDQVASRRESHVLVMDTDTDTVDLIKGNRTRVGRTCPREEVNQQSRYIHSDYLPDRYYRLILCAYALELNVTRPRGVNFRLACFARIFSSLELSNFLPRHSYTHTHERHVFRVSRKFSA